MSLSQTYRESTPLLNRGRLGWALFDWANQAFTTIIITFVFAQYFSQGIVGDGAKAQILWLWGVSATSAFFVAILAPILGAVADMGGNRRPWVIGFSCACILFTLGLYFMLPDPQYAVAAVLLVAIANICYEMSIVFNNAMLVDLVDRPRLAKLSGLAWSSGYFGGLVALGLCLAVVLALPETLGLDTASAQEVRLTPVIVAVWFAIFLIPFILWTPDKPATGMPMRQAIRQGLSKLWRTMRDIASNDRNILWFLLGRMTYIDGVNTIFAAGGVYAAGRYGLDTNQLIMFGILLNVFSGAGGMLFAFFEERIGTKLVIMIAIAALAITVTCMLLAPDFWWFTGFGCALGVFVGPIQQASRTMMAKLAPEESQAELFGLYAFSGKATSLLGPILVGALTAIALGLGLTSENAQTFGMFGVMPFLMVGFIIMLFVRAPTRNT